MTTPGGDPVAAIEARITDRDVKYNSTLQSLENLSESIEAVYADRASIDTIVDLGCGYGGFSAALADVVAAETVHGIDTDEEKRSSAASRGLTTHDLDLESDPLPFADGAVDLVVCFGLLEHLREYDHLLTEVDRVLRRGGWFWLAVPNLAGWTNRLALLFGYQPRNVEVSTEQAVGILPMYGYQGVLGHVHAPTYRAICELLEYWGYEIESVTSLSPYQRSSLVRLVDRTLGRSPRFARRISILCRR